MRAISLWQSWASLCLVTSPRRLKLHETRHWPTDYRGPLAIHAAQRLVTDLEPALCRLLAETFGVSWRRALPRGRMLGTVVLAGCTRTEDLSPDPLDELCGDWTAGRFAWRLEEPQAFGEPPIVKGRQGFFTWSYDVDEGSTMEPLL